MAARHVRPQPLFVLSLIDSLARSQMPLLLLLLGARVSCVTTERSLTAPTQSPDSKSHDH